MSTTFVQPGEVLDLVAPAGGVVSGTPVLIGGMLVIPLVTAAATVTFPAKNSGVHLLPKVGSQAWNQLDRIYWDNANTRCSSDFTVGPFIGTAAAAVTNAAGNTTGLVLLNEMPAHGGLFHARVRLAIAAVNAGANLVAAVPGCRLRLVDAYAISVGGATTSVTTVDLLGTVTTDRKLVAFGQAALTQSALVRAGSAGGVLLADGASFTQNDANTPLKAFITGSAITVATSIDFILTYALDPA